MKKECMTIFLQRKNNMKLDEIKEWNRHQYLEQCKFCGFKYELLTQEDINPEYHTDIYLKCQCGEYVEFVLPVN